MEISTDNGRRTQTSDNLAAIRRVTWIGMFANVGLVFLKLAGGHWGYSKVLIADAVHSLSDLVTDFAILIGARYWGEPADESHPHGHAKIESLVTLFIGGFLALVGIGLIWNAVMTIFDFFKGNPLPLPTWFPLVVAIISVITKEYIYRITLHVGLKTQSSALIANAWHHRSDSLSSIPAVLTIACCLILGEQYTFLDPVGTIVVACMIIHAAWKILHPAAAILLDAGAPRAMRKEILERVIAFSEVQSLHKLRTRRVGPSSLAVDLHIRVDPEMTVVVAHALSHSIQQSLLHHYADIVEVLIHVEPIPKEMFDPDDGQRYRGA